MFQSNAYYFTITRNIIQIRLMSLRISLLLPISFRFLDLIDMIAF